MSPARLHEQTRASRAIIEASGLPVTRVSRSYEEGAAVVEIATSGGETAKGICSSGSLEAATIEAVNTAQQEWAVSWAFPLWEV